MWDRTASAFPVRASCLSNWLAPGPPQQKLPLTATRLRGMVLGMATTKITITVQNAQLEEIRALVAAGQAANVSAFVQRAIEVALYDAAGWKEMLSDALEETGGPLTKKERSWADAILSSRPRRRDSRRGRAA